MLSMPVERFGEDAPMVSMRKVVNLSFNLKRALMEVN